MTARLAKDQHTALHGAPCFRHQNTAFLWILRRVVANRDLINSRNATGQLRPIRLAGRVADGVGIGVELQGDSAAASEQAGNSVLVHGPQRPVDVLVKCNVQTVLGNLPFCEPHVGIAGFLARDDVLRLDRPHVHPIDWLVGADVAHPNTGIALALFIRTRRGRSRQETTRADRRAPGDIGRETRKLHRPRPTCQGWVRPVANSKSAV